MKRFATICSGIGAPEQAAKGLDWKPVFNAEIESFPSAVLKHHYPKTPNYGDITKYEKWPTKRLNLLVAGTPCQSFSVAGLRKGLADPRGNLTLTFLAIVARHRPAWILWENVPGVLSDKTGAFGALLTGLAECGYGTAYRVLDAQYFGLAQRRKRVFVVGHIGGEWQRAAAVLFERESLCGYSPPGRKTRKEIAPTISARTKCGGGLGTDFDCDGGCIPIQEIGKRQSGTSMNGVGHGRPGDPMFTLQSSAVHGVLQPIGIDGGEVGYAPRSSASHSGDKGDGGVNTTMVAETAPNLVSNGDAHSGFRDEHGIIPEISPCLKRNNGKNSDAQMESSSLITEVAHALKADGFDASEDGTGRGTPIIPEVLAHGQGNAERVIDGSPSLTCNHEAPILFAQNTRDEVRLLGDNIAGALPAQPGMKQQSYLKTGMAVRRLTPRECERLQGFPDNYTLIEYNGKPAKDAPRYKALGNSMAVPVIRWILNRIDAIDEMKQK